MDSRKKVSMSLDPAFKFLSKLKGLSEASGLRDQFREFQDVLIGCEKQVFIDMEGLQRRLDLVEEDRKVLEDDNQFSEIEKCKIWKDLVKSQKECDEVKGELERASHRLVKFHEERQQITDEKNNVIHELIKSRQECEGMKERIAMFHEEQCQITEEKNNAIHELINSQQECERMKEELKSSSDRIAMFHEEQCQSTEEKNKVAHELEKSRKECRDLKGQVEMFNRIAKFRAEECAVTDEKNKVIANLKEKVAKLEIELQDSEFLCEHTNAAFREELKVSKEHADQIVEGLRQKELEVERWTKKYDHAIELLQKQQDLEKTITELRRKEEEGTKKFEVLMQQNMETIEAVDVLKRNKLEDEKLIFELRQRETDNSNKFEHLRRQYIATSLANDVMKRKQIDCEKDIEELKRKEADLNKKVEQLRRQTVTPKAVDCMRCKDKENIHVELRRKEIQAHNKIAELRQHNYEASRVVAQLEHEKLEAAKSKTEMENRLMEKEKLLGTCQQELKVLSDKVALTEQELHDLKGRKLDADKIIELLRQNQTRSDETAEELRCQYLEAPEKLKQPVLNVETDNLTSEEKLQDMRHKHSKVQQTVEELGYLIKDANQEVLPELKMLAEGLIDSLEAEVKDLANVVLKDGSNDKQTSGDFSLGGAMDTDVGIIATTATGVCQDVNSTEPACSELQNTVGDRRVKASLDDSVLGEKRKFGLLSSSSHSDRLLKFTPRRKRSSRANGNVTFRNDTQQKNQIPISTDERDDSLGSKLSGRPNPRSSVTIAQAVSPIGSNPVLKRCKENAVAASCSPIQLNDVDSSSDHEGSDSDDDSCSEASINDYLAALRIRKLSKTWMSQADMLRDFQEDVDHCMNAVCVLQRQKMSIPGSSAGSNGGFSHFEAMRGPALAEYLIDGDLKYRLRKPVSDIQEQRPDVLVQCRAIAMAYGERLYSIYCNREDPFFRSR